MQQAVDFRAESEALFGLLDGADTTRFDEPTLFKDWTINAVLQHLYFWNQMAGLQLTDEAELSRRPGEVMRHEGGMRGFERAHFNEMGGRELLDSWHQDVAHTAHLLAEADPKARLKWAGPDMSARTSITARLMETWAHGQAIYDALGQQRPRTDRIRHIVALGVNTFAFNFKTHGKTPPDRMPFLQLSAPSGDIWCHGDEANNDRICGEAFEFCQVVTQVRHIDDTNLTVTGDTARQWMAIAQCFAGPAHPPPAPGSRFIR